MEWWAIMLIVLSGVVALLTVLMVYTMCKMASICERLEEEMGRNEE